ncbi:MAG: T9SS type A sorting domain-containing protein, partial [Bacteroidota bacterium]
ISELTNIAWQNAWEFGDAVFIARSLLGLEVDDQMNNLRMGNNNEKSTEQIAYPNPASASVRLNGLYNEKIIVCDVSGRVVKITKLNSDVLDVTELENGLYIVTNMDNSFYCKINVYH